MLRSLDILQVKQCNTPVDFAQTDLDASSEIWTCSPIE